jgi:hypothetical protein
MPGAVLAMGDIVVSKVVLISSTYISSLGGERPVQKNSLCYEILPWRELRRSRSQRFLAFLAAV